MRKAFKELSRHVPAYFFSLFLSSPSVAYSLPTTRTSPLNNWQDQDRLLTWCPEQMGPPPFGNRARNGLWTGQEVRGPQREGPGNGTELLKLFVDVGHGLQLGSGGPWNDDDWEGPKPLCTPIPPLPFPISIDCGGGGGGYDDAAIIPPPPIWWPCGQLMPDEPIVRPGQPVWPFEWPRLHWLAAITMSPRLLWWAPWPPPKPKPRPPPPPPLAPQNWWSTAKLSWLPEHCRRWDEGGGDEFRE